MARPWAAPVATVSLLVVALSIAAAPVTAGQTFAEGIDVSHHNGSIDWSAAGADGVSFVIAKATEGQSFTDARYGFNRARADAVGLPFTAYHFARPDTTTNDAVLEADHFVDTALLRGRHLVPVLDLEVSGGLGPRKLRAWTKAWLERVRMRLGVKPLIYTSPSFWVEQMGDTRSFADRGYRLWIAHWDVAQPRVPASNWGGRGWTLWQYSSCGTVAGFDGCVDLDRYAGTVIGALRIKNNR